MNAAYAAASIHAGINLRQLQDVFSMVGIDKQPAPSTVYERQGAAREEILSAVIVSCQSAFQDAISAVMAEDADEDGVRLLPVSFDSSWTHVREAGESSGEMVCLKALPGRNPYPIIAHYLVYKSRGTDEGRVREGNHEASSREMEHACLLALLEQVRPALLANNIMLDMVVDGDLSTNATLMTTGCVKRISVDLAHRIKRVPKFFDKLDSRHPAKPFKMIARHLLSTYAFGSVRWGKSERDLRHFLAVGVYAHLCGDHQHCWAEACIHVRNNHLTLAEPNLLSRTYNDRAAVRDMLERIYATPAEQRLVTILRSSVSESIHHEKQRRCPKTTDFWMSFRERLGLGIISHNDGPENAARTVRIAYGVPADVGSATAQRILRREEQVEANRAAIPERNEEREQARRALLESYETVGLVAYGAQQQQLSSDDGLPDFWSLQASVDLQELGSLPCLRCGRWARVNATGRCDVCELFVMAESMFQGGDSMFQGGDSMFQGGD